VTPGAVQLLTFAVSLQLATKLAQAASKLRAIARARVAFFMGSGSWAVEGDGRQTDSAKGE
jgi:hypothetical protein